MIVCDVCRQEESTEGPVQSHSLFLRLMSKDGSLGATVYQSPSFDICQDCLAKLKDVYKDEDKLIQTLTGAVALYD